MWAPPPRPGSVARGSPPPRAAPSQARCARRRYAGDENGSFVRRCITVLRSRGGQALPLLRAQSSAVVRRSTLVIRQPPHHVADAAGYPPMLAGAAMAPRGIGSFFMMPVTGLLTGRFDPRKLLTIGLIVGGGTLLWLSRLNLQSGYWDIFWPSCFRARDSRCCSCRLPRSRWIRFPASAWAMPRVSST
jgi:hypothetical protein